MVSAEIIAIGTELLLGEILDTNTRFLARQLQKIGVNVYRASIVGDNSIRIAEAIRESLNRADVVITSGGLGPTVDDPTRDAVAIAFEVENEFQHELWLQIEDRFSRRGLKPTENNRRQAYLPIGAVGIPNIVGTAPAFYFKKENKILFSLPGVPSELEYLYENAVKPILKDNFRLDGVIKTRIIHTAGVGESVIDSMIGDLELLQNPTVGLAAHPGNVDIRITARAESAEAADEMINKIAEIVEHRLSPAIFGFDGETLPQQISNKLIQEYSSLSCILSGISRELVTKNIPENSDQFRVLFLEDSSFDTNPTEIIPQNLLLNATLEKGSQPSRLLLSYQAADEVKEACRVYSGPPDQVDLWAWNTCLAFIWEQINSGTRRANDKS